MRLRIVQLTHQSTSSVALWDQRCWVPLKPALTLYRKRAGRNLPELDAASHDVVTFLQHRYAIRQQADTLLDFVRAEGISLADSFDPQPVLPFQPLSFRDFMLYEQHAVDAGRGLVKRFFPWRNRLLLAYESLTGRRHPGLHPGKLWYEKPIYYMGNHLAFVTECDVIPWPAYTQTLDYELELGVVMARAVRNVAPPDALDAIGGFTLVNDFSARDVQYAEMISGFGPVKSKNFATAMSVDVVTADEVLPYVEDLDVQVRVNGDIWGKGNTRGVQHSIGEMIAYASRGELLRPGELLATGTIPGCSGLEVGRWLSPGDHVELWIERVGTLKNVVGQPGS